jgi:hypothetical protein
MQGRQELSPVLNTQHIYDSITAVVFLFYCQAKCARQAPQEYFQISVLADATGVLPFFYKGRPLRKIGRSMKF